MNPYTILEVTPQASDEEIKKKFRTLAQRHHPDRGGNEEIFKQVNLAYSILSDPARRKHFDATGEYNINQGVREEALGNIAMIFTIFVNRINPDLEDLVVLMKNDINGEKNKTHTAIAEALVAITKLEKVLKKLRRKKEGESILKLFAKEQIKQQENHINNLNKKLEVCDKMLEILDDYRYGDEEFEMLMNSAISSNQEAHSQ